MRRSIGVAIAMACVIETVFADGAAARRKATVFTPATWSDVEFPAQYPFGSIVVVNKERVLYFVAEEGRARRYPVAIGTPDEQWTGKEIVAEMRENPRWFPVRDDDDTPDPVPGGDPRNPLGARAIYLRKTLWRIHGTIVPGSIGKAVSNGCFRMHNAHVIDLFERVSIGAEVYVVQTLHDRLPMRRGRKLDS